MNPFRRTCLTTALTAALTAGLAAAAGPALAQDAYPSRPIRIVIPTPAGGGLDGTVRAIAEKLQGAWKQPVVVESRAGGNGAIAYSAVANAPADGYTVVVSLSSLVQTPLLTKTPTYKVDDLAPVSLVAMLPNGFAIGKDVPAANLEQFVQWARQQPKGVTYGSSGAGSSGNIMGGTLAKLAGLDMLHVPFKGEAPVIQALLGGEIQGAMAAPGSLAVHAKTGSIKLLAVALPNRLRDYPDVPTFGELGYPAVNPPRPGRVREWRYDADDAGAAVELAQGAEMGRFLLGSTVVLLFPPGGLAFNPAWMPGGAVRMGEMMARRWVTRAAAPGRT